MDYTIIGIDFGTSTTLVKFKNHTDGENSGESHYLTFDGHVYLPSLVFEDSEGLLHIGYDVEAQLLSGASGTLHNNLKSSLSGTSSQHVQARRLTEAFFKYIYSVFDRERERLLLPPCLKTYVGYPADSSLDTQHFIKQCVVNAGFGTPEDVFVERAAIATLHAALFTHIGTLQDDRIVVRHTPTHALLLDMGAGGTDVSILRFSIGEGNIPQIEQLLATAPPAQGRICGGDEIDKVLADYLNGHIMKMLNGNRLPDAVLRSVDSIVKVWKEKTVCPHLKANKRVWMPGYIASQLQMLIRYDLLNDVHFNPIDRPLFELLTRPHWQQWHALMADSLDEAKRTFDDFNGAEDIDLIVLTGGHSRWYGVEEFILGRSFAGLKPFNFLKIQKLPQRLLTVTEPQDAVADGLILKNIPFKMKYTIGDAMWVQFEIAGKKSGLFEVISVDDVLPIPNEKNKGILHWQVTIKSTSYTWKKVKIVCYCAYGEKFNAASARQIEKVVPLNDCFVGIAGMLFRGLEALGIELWNMLTMKWDKMGYAFEKCFREEYLVKLSSSLHVSEEGKGYLKIRVDMDWNNISPIVIEIP